MSASNIFSDFDRLHSELVEAVVACRAHASKHAVHSVRTGTRKLEAVLRKLVEDHPGATRLRTSAKETGRELKRIRKAAGPVRDLDVHRQLAKELRSQRLAAGGSASADDLDHGHRQLDHALQQRRERAAAKLEKVLKKEEVRLEAALEHVSKAMSHLRAASPPPLTTAREWARNSSMPSNGDFQDNLHGYRKQTKPARYLAGLEEASAPARRLAKRLKKMQDTIGRWHDLMLLADEAEKVLGKRAALTRITRAERDRALDAATRSANVRSGSTSATAHA